MEHLRKAAGRGGFYASAVTGLSLWLEHPGQALQALGLGDPLVLMVGASVLVALLLVAGGWFVEHLLAASGAYERLMLVVATAAATVVVHLLARALGGKAPLPAPGPIDAGSIGLVMTTVALGLMVPFSIRRLHV